MAESSLAPTGKSEINGGASANAPGGGGGGASGAKTNAGLLKSRRLCQYLRRPRARRRGEARLSTIFAAYAGLVLSKRGDFPLGRAYAPLPRGPKKTPSRALSSASSRESKVATAEGGCWRSPDAMATAAGSASNKLRSAWSFALGAGPSNNTSVVPLGLASCLLAAPSTTSRPNAESKSSAAPGASMTSRSAQSATQASLPRPDAGKTHQDAASSKAWHTRPTPATTS